MYYDHMQAGSHSINLTSNTTPMTTPTTAVATSSVRTSHPSINHVSPTGDNTTDVTNTSISGCSLPMVISFLIDVYFESPVPNLSFLYERILNTHLQDGWASDNQLISRSCIVITKLFSYSRVNVLLSNDAIYNWSIEINQCRINLPHPSLLNFQEDTITSLASLWSLLDSIDKSWRNQDEKFLPIKDRRKGKFLDHSGE